MIGKVEDVSMKNCFNRFDDAAAVDGACGPAEATRGEKLSDLTGHTRIAADVVKRETNFRSRRKLKAGDARRFAHLGPPLFVELATVVCSTGVLPEKELHECWQMAAVVHREFPGSLRVADIAAGHGLLAWILVLLGRSDERMVLRTAVAIDITRPKSAAVLAAAIVERWPHLAGAVDYVEGSVDAVMSEPASGTLFVSAHACGSLSDRVLLAAMASRSPVAIMPCCHSLRKQRPSLSSLATASGMPCAAVDGVAASVLELGQPAAIDRFRVKALEGFGYEVSRASIQPEVTAFNRIVLGRPAEGAHLPFARQGRAVGGHTKRLGEVRAYETLQSLDAGNLSETRALSKRRSRVWLRTFDLSYWVDSDATGQRLVAALEILVDGFLAEDPAVDAHAVLRILSSDAAELRRHRHEYFARSVSIRDRYTDPVTRRLARTYRVELGSESVAITKNDAGILRGNVRSTMECLATLMGASFEPR